jgi:CubicO group peptidase (beta-lactamase class C family)
LPPRADYRYTMPRDRKDGLRVGSLDGSGLDPARIEAMVQGIARGDYPDVHSLLVVKNGALVLEEYFYEYDADTLHPLRSATKSVVSALAGVAIDNRLLAGAHEPVLPHFEPQYGRIENVTDAKRRITLEHLLTNSSGLDCNDYDGKSAGNESLMGRTDDWVKFILDLPMIEEPGGTARGTGGGCSRRSGSRPRRAPIR